MDRRTKQLFSDPAGFKVAYLKSPGFGNFVPMDGGAVTWVLGPRATRELAVVVFVGADVDLGERLHLLVTTTGETGAVDAVLIKVTNVSTPD